MESFYGYVASPLDAALLIAAAHADCDLVRQIGCRLDHHDRAKIRSGSVFVFSENDSGMRRWTDGIRWTKSRVEGAIDLTAGLVSFNARCPVVKLTTGQFLVYRRLMDQSSVEDLPPVNAASRRGRARRISDDSVETFPDPTPSPPPLATPDMSPNRDMLPLKDSFVLCKKTFSIQSDGNTNHVVIIVPCVIIDLLLQEAGRDIRKTVNP